MKRLSYVILSIFLVTILASCGRNVPVEELSIPLILGIDLDENNNLIFSQSSPVFNKESKKNIESFQLEAKSIRDSRKYFDALSTGEVTAAKIQVLLIGTKVLEHEGWFSILDTVYRNPAFSLNTKVIVIDGPVSDVIFHEPEDKVQLPLHLKKLIDKSITRSMTVIGTLQLLHRQMYEKGMTPSIPIIKKNTDVELVGIAMLNEDGKYVDSLTLQESSLLLILKDEKEQELTYSIPMTSVENDGGIFNKNELSIDINRVKSKVETKYEKNQFHFNYNIKLTVTIVERLFPEELVKEDELEKMIERELKSEFERIIEKIQGKEIDPIGLGLFARAYQYDQYKKVEDHWGKALAKSNINISLEINIKSLGAIK